MKRCPKGKQQLVRNNRFFAECICNCCNGGNSIRQGKRVRDIVLAELRDVIREFVTTGSEVKAAAMMYRKYSERCATVKLSHCYVLFRYLAFGTNMLQDMVLQIVRSWSTDKPIEFVITKGELRMPSEQSEPGEQAMKHQ